MGIQFVPDNVNVNFTGHRKMFWGISLFMIIMSLCFFFGKGLNYGIDFKGGYVIEARFPEKPDLTSLREKLKQAYQGEVSLQQFGTEGFDIVIKLEKMEDSEKILSETDGQEVVVNKVKETLGEGVSYRKIETIGPTVGKELVQNAIKAVLLSLIAIALYICFRFEWPFAVSGLLALAQDCICLIGSFALFKLEFSASSIVAVLTTASYSINDTIVIFDRVRENISRYRKSSFEEIINKSINETLSRTVLTAGTTLLAVLALCLFGGKVIQAFSLPIFIGITLGTFSSIAVSAPLLLLFPVNREKIIAAKTRKVTASS